MKILVGITGCTGSLGKTLLKTKSNINFRCFLGDVRDRMKIFEWVKKNDFDAIIHLAAIVPIKEVNSDKKKAKQVNYSGTKNIVDAVLKKKISWFFFSSTSHVYKSVNKKISESAIKRPISFYGKTKLLAENYIIKSFKRSNIRYCIGRIFSTSNKNQKKNYLVPDLKNKIKKTKDKISFKNLNHYRDFISMDEISKIILDLYKKRYQGIINIGRGEGIFLKDIAKLICKKYNKKFAFKDSKKITYLVANNEKLKKYFSFKKLTKLEKLIF